MRSTTAIVALSVVASILGILPPLVERFQVDTEHTGMLENHESLRDQFFACTPHPTTAMNTVPSAPQRATPCAKRHGKRGGLRAFPKIDAANGGGHTYRFTRQTRVFESMSLPGDLNWVQTLTQKKEFMWIGMTSGEWMFGAALLRFNYNNGVVVHLYNAKSQQSFFRQIEIPIIAPFSGPYFIPNADGDVSIAAPGHCVTFNSLASVFSTNVSACATERRTFALKLTTVFNKCAMVANEVRGASCAVPFEIEFEIEVRADDDFMSLVYPLGPRRAAVVTKVAAAPVRNLRMSLSGAQVTPHPTSVPLASLDYTRGLLRRLTIWRWASMSAMALDKKTGARVPVGFHISRDTYDYMGASVESAVYGTNSSSSSSISSSSSQSPSAPVGDRRFVNFLDDPTITITKLSKAPAGDAPTDKRPPYESLWQLRGCNGALDLIFTPAGPHFHGDFHYGILDGDLFHMWGTYTGKVPRVFATSALRRECDARRDIDACALYVKDAPGVLEEHYALW